MRVFLLSFAAGLITALLVALLYPYTDQVRYRSLSSAMANGGRLETFYVELPADRLLPAQDVEFGAPGDRDVRAELFRIRDAEDRIVGLAGKLSGDPGTGVSVSDWTLAISGRGGLFLTQVNEHSLVLESTRIADSPPGLEMHDGRGLGSATTHPASGGDSNGGRVLGGTGEFTGLTGTYDESWQVVRVSAGDEMTGRIVLTTRIMGGS